MICVTQAGTALYRQAAVSAVATMPTGNPNRSDSSCSSRACGMPAQPRPVVSGEGSKCCVHRSSSCGPPEACRRPGCPVDDPVLLTTALDRADQRRPLQPAHLSSHSSNTPTTRQTPRALSPTPDETAVWTTANQPTNRPTGLEPSTARIRCRSARKLPYEWRVLVAFALPRSRSASSVPLSPPRAGPSPRIAVRTTGVIAP